ncbi:MAG TPA: ferredoxin [Methanosarcinaceae archaeon]|nr:ferredoxin [Methanosarcinaceae archaeon]
MVNITVDTEKCNGCGACVDACYRRVLEIHDGTCMPVKPEMCRFCMLCIPACKPKALSIVI